MSKITVGERGLVLVVDAPLPGWFCVVTVREIERSTPWDFCNSQKRPGNVGVLFP
jgi:hypothetical protein